MFKFETEVRLNADAAPDEIVNRLARLMAPPRSWGLAERTRPLRGRIGADRGFIRWPVEKGVASPRNLKFELVEDRGRTYLTGRFIVWPPLRIVVMTWLGFAVAFWSWALIRSLIYHAEARELGKDLLMILIPFCMSYGYLWFAVSVGRHRDRMLIRVLRIVLMSQGGATIVGQLLSRSKVNFIDPPVLETR
jgi:hypothetical protein